MPIISRIIPYLFITLCLPCYAQIVPPGIERDRLTFAELLKDKTAIEGPVHNGYFMPVGPVAAAEHELSATLIIPETDSWSFGAFPGVSVQMFTSGDRLIPVTRDIIRTDNTYQWNIIFSPGRIWSEPGDNGLSRASFPFVLVKKWPETARHGIATFLFDNRVVSPLMVQLTSKYDTSKARGRLPVSILHGKIKNRDRIEAEYIREMEQRLPTRPLTELAAKFGSQGQEALHLWPELENESVSGVYIDGVIYVGGCQTRFGPYPYCDEMRHSAYSMAKSLGALVAMLYLAHKYGDEVFDLKIKDYVDVWGEDTFADSLNMTSGGAGVFHYSGTLTKRLTVAMDRFLKSREGPNANLWDMVIEEVFRPIGVFHTPVNNIFDHDGRSGVPDLAGGMFPTYHDIVKVGLLLQNGGRYNGKQLLSAGKVREALYRTEKRGAPAPISNNPERSYFMSFWQVPIELGKCTINVSLMSGSGGKIAVLLPSGTVAFYVRNSRGKNFVQKMTIAANSLHSECQ
jgi:hypothetical protein